MKKVGEHPSRSMGFLSQYHDGELSPAEREAFDRHAAGCPECAAAAAEFEAVLAMYRESGVEPADPALARRISRRIDTELRRRPPSRFLSFRIDLLWATAIAVALVGAIALFAVHGRRAPGPVPVVVAEREPAAAPRPSAVSSAPAPPSAATPESAAPAAPRRRSENRSFAPERPQARDRGEGAAGGVEGGIEGGVVGGIPASQGAPAASPAPAPAIAAPASPRAKTRAETGEGPLRVGGPVTAPVLVRRVEPAVPPRARRLLVGSPVVVEAVISPEGNVVSTRIVRSNPAADRAVLDALRKWKYRPALLDGKPVAVYLTVTVRGE